MFVIVEDNCKCLSSTSSLCSDTAHNENYADMKPGSTSKSHDKNFNVMYMDMSGNHHLPYAAMQESKSTGYIDMTVGGRLSPNTKGIF